MVRCQTVGIQQRLSISAIAIEDILSRRTAINADMCIATVE